MNNLLNSKNTLWALLLLAMSTSCSHLGSGKDSQHIKLIREEIILNHDKLLLSAPITVFKVIGKDSLLVFDDSTHNLILFDLEKKRPIWSHKFEIDGPNFLDTPVFDIAMTNDKIHVLSQSHFSTFNLKGEIIQRYDENQIEGFNSEFTLHSFEFIEPNKIAFPKLLYSAVSPSYSTGTKESIFVEFDLLTNEFKSLNIFSPQESLISNPDIGYYNDFSEHNALIVKGDLVYNFQFSSKIYLYNFSNKRLESFKAESDFSENVRTPLSSNPSMQELAEYYYTGPRFYSLDYDSLTNTYIRLHFEYLLTTTGNRIMTKYVTVFDDKFKHLLEIPLPHIESVNLFVNKGKIYIWKTSSYITQENAFELITYEIQYSD